MKILIIGLGSIAKKHIAAIKFLYKKPLFYALRINKNEIIQDVKNIYDFNEINIIQPDFIIISNPTIHHLETIKKLLNFNIPLFIEKPPFHTLFGLKKILKTTYELKLLNYVACNMRFHPCILFLKEYIKSNSIIINEVNVYCGSFLPDWRPLDNYKNSYSANKNLGGGVHLDLFHEFDYINWIFGFPKKKHRILASKSNLKINSYDYANYVLEYDNFHISIILNYYRKDPKRNMEIVFNNETWNIDLLKGTILNDKLDVIFMQKNFSMDETYILQMRYFLRQLKRKIKPMNSIEESIKALKIILNNE